jgi:hypothetical protein
MEASIKKVEACMKAEPSQGEKEGLSLQEPASQQLLKKLLMPFLKTSWTSNKVGLLDISGDACSGQLMVKIACCRCQSAKPRRVHIDGNRLYLERFGLAPLKLIPSESHVGKHGSWYAAWEGSCGEHEVWNQFGTRVGTAKVVSTSGITMCSAITAPESAEDVELICV